MEPPPKKSMCDEIEICENEPPFSFFAPRKKRKQTGWFNLPYEIRVMIIDLMDLNSLCRFAQCSVFCNEEVIYAKSYFRKMELKKSNVIFWQICFSRQNEEPTWSLEFSCKDGMTQIRCLSKNGSKTHWTQEEEGEGVDVFIRHVNMYVHRFQHILETFEMREMLHCGSALLNDIQIRNMRRLEHLYLNSHNTMPLSKRKIVDLSLVKSITKSLELTCIEINFTQLVNLRAESIIISFKRLTSKDLNRYIKHWREGKIDPNVKEIIVNNTHRSRNKFDVDLCGLEFEYLNKRQAELVFVVRSRCKSRTALVTLTYGLRFEMIIKVDKK